MKDAYYFSHDSNAHKDPKILKLRAAHGWYGYGVFWAIIETLREQDEYKWKAIDKHLLSFCFSNGESEVNQIIETCLEVGLLMIDDDGFIYSSSLSNRMKKKEEIAEKRRQAGQKGGSKQSQSKSKANAKQNESKERKGNEIKGNEIKEDFIDIQEPDSNPYKDQLSKLIKQCEIEDVTLYHYDIIFSYIGMMDIEVIEAAIKKSQGKHVNYLTKTLTGMHKEGFKKEDLLPKGGQVNDKHEKSSENAGFRVYQTKSRGNEEQSEVSKGIWDDTPVPELQRYGG